MLSRAQCSRLSTQRSSGPLDLSTVNLLTEPQPPLPAQAPAPASTEEESEASDGRRKSKTLMGSVLRRLSRRDLVLESLPPLPLACRFFSDSRHCMVPVDRIKEANSAAHMAGSTTRLVGELREADEKDERRRALTVELERGGQAKEQRTKQTA